MLLFASGPSFYGNEGRIKPMKRGAPEIHHLLTRKIVNPPLGTGLDTWKHSSAVLLGGRDGAGAGQLIIQLLLSAPSLCSFTLLLHSAPPLSSFTQLLPLTTAQQSLWTTASAKRKQEGTRTTQNPKTQTARRGPHHRDPPTNNR